MDKNNIIGIECTQLISKFHRERCISYQSALIEAPCKKEPLPKKESYGITETFIMSQMSGLRCFKINNHYDKNAVFKDAEKLIKQKQLKYSLYRKNAKTDRIFLLILTNAFGGEIMKDIKKHIGKTPLVRNKQSDFYPIIWQSLSDKDEIEIVAPYEQLT